MITGLKQLHTGPPTTPHSRFPNGDAFPIRGVPGDTLKMMEHMNNENLEAIHAILDKQDSNSGGDLATRVEHSLRWFFHTKYFQSVVWMNGGTSNHIKHTKHNILRMSFCSHNNERNLYTTRVTHVDD